MDLTPSFKNWLYALSATIIGFLISKIVVYGLASIAAFSSANDSAEINFTDIYDRVADKRDVCTLSDDIVIVSVDGCNREQIAATIDAVSFFEPSAIGLDLFFIYPSVVDGALIEAIRSSDKIVLPISDGEEPVVSYFYPQLNNGYGCVNMTTNSSYEIVRDFIPVFDIDSLKVPCMALAIAEKVSGREIKEEELSEKIWYSSVDFDIINSSELLDSSGFPIMEAAGRIKDKAVLIGVVNDGSDMHRTPVKEQMAGIEIHAHILDTILHNKRIDEIGGFWEMIIAVVCCLLFLRLHLFFKDWLDDVGEMIMRVLQFVLIYIFLVLGANLYIKHHCLVDFSTTLLMLGFSLTALSLIKGSVFLILKIKSNRKR